MDIWTYFWYLLPYWNKFSLWRHIALATVKALTRRKKLFLEIRMPFLFDIEGQKESIYRVQANCWPPAIADACDKEFGFLYGSRTAQKIQTNAVQIFSRMHLIFLCAYSIPDCRIPVIPLPNPIPSNSSILNTSCLVAFTSCGSNPIDVALFPVIASDGPVLFVYSHCLSPLYYQIVWGICEFCLLDLVMFLFAFDPVLLSLLLRHLGNSGCPKPPFPWLRKCFTSRTQLRRLRQKNLPQVAARDLYLLLTHIRILSTSYHGQLIKYAVDLALCQSICGTQGFLNIPNKLSPHWQFSCSL